MELWDLHFESRAYVELYNRLEYILSPLQQRLQQLPQCHKSKAIMAMYRLLLN